VEFATSWYSSASALFWATLALLVVGIATGLVTVMIYRSGTIRKCLLFSIISRTRLLTAPEAMNELEVSYQGERLTDPYVTAIELTNIGKSAIPSVSFDRGRGVELNLNVQILKVLAIEQRPLSAPKPSILADGTKFILEPELIARSETITVSVLTEGSVENINLIFNPFGEVEIKIRDRVVWQRQRNRQYALITAACTAVGVAIAAFVSPYIATPQAISTGPTTAEKAYKAGVPTFAEYSSASEPGPIIAFGQEVEVSCKVYALSLPSINPGGYWYRIASAPWDNSYYAPASTFWNGRLTRHYDPRVPNCFRH
jgi:hypothetical protein